MGDRTIVLAMPSINNMQKIKGFPTFLWKYLNKTTISFKFLINLCSNYYLIFVYDSFFVPLPRNGTNLLNKGNIPTV